MISKQKSIKKLAEKEGALLERLKSTVALQNNVNSTLSIVQVSSRLSVGKRVGERLGDQPT